MFFTFMGDYANAGTFLLFVHIFRKVFFSHSSSVRCALFYSLCFDAVVLFSFSLLLLCLTFIVFSSFPFIFFILFFYCRSAYCYFSCCPFFSYPAFIVLCVASYYLTLICRGMHFVLYASQVQYKYFVLFITVYFLNVLRCRMLVSEGFMTLKCLYLFWMHTLLGMLAGQSVSCSLEFRSVRSCMEYWLRHTWGIVGFGRWVLLGSVHNRTVITCYDTPGKDASSQPEGGAVALLTGGVYCAQMYSEQSLSWAAAAVKELWQWRVYRGPGSWSRAWTVRGGLTGSREPAPGSRQGCGRRSRETGWVLDKYTGRTVNGLTQKGVRDQLKRTKTQVK